MRVLLCDKSSDVFCTITKLVPKIFLTLQADVTIKKKAGNSKPFVDWRLPLSNLLLENLLTFQHFQVSMNFG
jgi:hypothetical protein